MMLSRSIQRVCSRSVRYAHTARAIVFSEYGPPRDVLSVQKFTVPDPEEKDIVLKLVAAPINPADLNQIEGFYPSKPKFTKSLGTSDELAIGGNEGLFEVLEVGSEETSFKVGDWVLPRSYSYGTWATHRLAKAEELINLGPARGLDPISAATVSVNPSTAYRMLQDFANLEPGDWFIQNGGNSGVGRMAIQLAKLWGYKSISVVRDRKDIEQLKSELTDLGADHIVTEEQLADKSIRHVIEEWTNGQPIKLGLNCVGGRSTSNMARQIGENGKLVTYGGMSKQPVSLPTTLFIFKNISTYGFWMTRWTKGNEAARERMIHELTDMFRQNEIVTTAVKSHKVKADIDDAALLELFKTALNEPGKNVLVSE